MTTSTPASLRSSWLADDGNNPSASEALGLVGVAICGDALVCMGIRDIFKDRARSDLGHEPDLQRWQREIDGDRSQERRRLIAGSRAIAEQHFVNRPAVALAAAGTENFDRGRTRD